MTAEDSGGVLEFVEDGVTGYVAPPDAAQGFARRLDELRADPELAQRLGSAGATRVTDIHWDGAIAALLEAGATGVSPGSP